MSGPRGRRVADLPGVWIAEDGVPRAKSLIVTLYGDAIRPRGGTLWLGSLIRLAEPFSINERLVRTSVLRLSRDGWLASTIVGRRSYYALTEGGHRRASEADRRIYATPGADWSGRWSLVFLSDPAVLPVRDRVRRELALLGFGQIGPDLMVHPQAEVDGLRHVLADLGLSDHVVVMHAEGEAGFARSRAAHRQALSAMVERGWDLAVLRGQYQAFLDRFRPLWRLLDAEEAPEPALAFALRIHMVHAYRRIVLRDPLLPDELLPADWPGTHARSLFRNTWLRLREVSEAHLDTIGETADGPLPAMAPAWRRRFQGTDLPDRAMRENRRADAH